MKKPLSPSKGFTRELIGKLQDMFGHSILKSSAFDEVPTENLDRFVKFMGSGLQSGVTAMMTKRFKAFNESSQSVLVDYSEAGELFKGLDVFPEVDPRKIPICGSGKINHRVFEICLHLSTWSMDLPTLLLPEARKIGFDDFMLVDPLTFLKYSAIERPHHSKTFATEFNDTKGNPWRISSHEAGKVNLRPGNDGTRWCDWVYFLVVPCNSNRKELLMP